MRERDVENYLCQRIADIGGLCLKWTSPGVRGVPDRILLLPARETIVPGWPTGYVKRRPAEVVFVELKAPGAKPVAYQRRFHERLAKLGFEVVVLDSPQAVDLFVDTL